MAEERKKSKLEIALAKLEKKHGKGTIQNLNDESLDFSTYNRIPTGSIGYDLALGGGWVQGRIHELYGWESSAKSTTALHAIVEAQKLGIKCAYVDAEYAYDKNYAESIGVDNSALIFTQPDYGEEGLDTVIELINTGEVKLIIVDSVPAMIPQKILLGEVGDAHMGVAARMWSQNLPKISNLASKNDCTIIFINQLRHNIGGYGNQNVTVGGNAMKFYASIRVSQSSSKSAGEKDGTEQVSNRVTIKIDKNKTYPPYKEAVIYVMFGVGFDKVREIIDLGIELDVIQKAGSWYSYGDMKIGQGIKAVKTLFEDNPELALEIEDKVRTLLNLK